MACVLFNLSSPCTKKVRKGKTCLIGSCAGKRNAIFSSGGGIDILAVFALLVRCLLRLLLKRYVIFFLSKYLIHLPVACGMHAFQPFFTMYKKSKKRKNVPHRKLRWEAERHLQQRRWHRHSRRLRPCPRSLPAPSSPEKICYICSFEIFNSFARGVRRKPEKRQGRKNARGSRPILERGSRPILGAHQSLPQFRHSCWQALRRHHGAGLRRWMLLVTWGEWGVRVGRFWLSGSVDGI